MKTDYKQFLVEYNSSIQDIRFLSDRIVKEQKQKLLELINVCTNLSVDDRSLARMVMEVSPEQSRPVKVPNNRKVYFMPTSGGFPSSLNATMDWPLPVFEMGSTFTMHSHYVEQNRGDIFHKFLIMVGDHFVKKEEDNLFRLLVPAATYSSNKVVKVEGSPDDSVCGRKLVEALIEEMQDRYRTLTHLLVSKEDLEDLSKDYPFHESLRIAGVNKYSLTVGSKEEGQEDKEITVIVVDELGLQGKYNISRDYSIFRPDDNLKFSGYQLSKAPLLSEEGEVIEPGETQVYGLDLTDKENSFVMNITQDYQFQLTPESEKNEKKEVEFWGSAKAGFAVTDISAVVAGVIDRSKT